MAPTATPIQPVPQHLQALARANEVRLARAELKRQVAEGELTVACVILGCPWQADSMTISDLLTSQKRWGSTRCRKILQEIPMSENKTVGSMTERQRRALVKMLDPDYPLPPPKPVTAPIETHLDIAAMQRELSDRSEASFSTAS
jgi:hypothetical protein